MGGLGSSETLYFVHKLKLKLSNEPISKLLTAKDEIIHIRLSTYIRDSFAILERKPSFSEEAYFAQSFESQMEGNSIFH